MKKNQNQPGDVVSARSRDTHFAGRLLAGKDDVTVQEKDQVLLAVLEKVNASLPVSENRPASGWKRLVAAGAAAAALLACVVGLWIWKANPNEAPHNAGSDVFTAKGDPAAASFFQVRCLAQGRPGECTPGARVIFSFNDVSNDVSEPAYFAALSVRVTDQTVIWMFPQVENGASIPLPPNTDTLKKAILLDSHYPPGKYEIIGLKSAHPLTRAQIKLFLAQQENPSDKGAVAHDLPITTSRLALEVKEP